MHHRWWDGTTGACQQQKCKEAGRVFRSARHWERGEGKRWGCVLTCWRSKQDHVQSFDVKLLFVSLVLNPQMNTQEWRLVGCNPAHRWQSSRVAATDLFFQRLARTTADKRHPHLGSVFPLTLKSLKFLSYWGNSTKSFSQRSTSSWVQLWTEMWDGQKETKWGKVELDTLEHTHTHTHTHTHARTHLRTTSSPSRAPQLWCVGLLCAGGCACWSAAASCPPWWTAKRQERDRRNKWKL